MESLPKEVLMRVHEYVPSVVASNDGHDTSPPTDSFRRALHSLTQWRCINHQWKNALDDSKALVWYYTAKAFALEPPLQLFAGGTYQGVCRLLLDAEAQKESAEETAASTPILSYACGMRMPPNPTDDHPRPNKPNVVLPTELVERVAANAKALERFLRSIDFGVLMGNQSTPWHESAWNRYRMFLYLKRTNPTVWLVPTADIEFVWLCHIFRTGMYWKDMTNLEIVPDHWLCLNYGEIATYSEAVRATEKLWDKTFGPNYPFLPTGTDVSWQIWKVERSFRYPRPTVLRSDPRRFCPVMGPEVLVPPVGLELPTIHLSAAEVKADLKWFPELERAQREICLNAYDIMRGAHECGDMIMAVQIVPSYEKFLNLCYQLRGGGDDVSFAPPYVIDLVWHAHQMEPHRYKEDCLSLFGCEFWHDPWPHGLGVSTELTNEFECAWKQAYGTSISEDWKLYLGGAGGNGDETPVRRRGRGMAWT